MCDAFSSSVSSPYSFFLDSALHKEAVDVPLVTSALRQIVALRLSDKQKMHQLRPTAYSVSG